MKLRVMIPLFWGLPYLTCAFITGGHPMKSTRHSTSRSFVEMANDAEIMSQGTLRGCSFQRAEGSDNEWVFQIDGVEADLGRFGEAIYKKVIEDAKRMKFQGFRAGTIPPHLEPTYRAFSMDECARETVLEAMEQNNIKPFPESRSLITIEKLSVPPPPKKASKRRKSKDSVAGEEEKPQVWLSFESMKEAIDAGWRPGQSFSFVARNVRGSKALL